VVRAAPLGDPWVWRGPEQLTAIAAAADDHDCNTTGPGRRTRRRLPQAQSAPSRHRLTAQLHRRHPAHRPAHRHDRRCPEAPQPAHPAVPRSRLSPTSSATTPRPATSGRQPPPSRGDTRAPTVRFGLMPGEAWSFWRSGECASRRVWRNDWRNSTLTRSLLSILSATFQPEASFHGHALEATFQPLATGTRS
jgi:hypothetical protein